MQATSKSALLASCASILAIVLGLSPIQARKEPIEKYQANALATAGPTGSRSSTLNINIYEWSDEEDQEIVLDAIKAATENRRAYRAVPDSLRKLGKAGYMFLAGGRGWPIRWARAFAVEGGREILLATDRPVTFSEIYSGSAVRDFDITLIVLKFEAGATEGEGIVSVGTEIVWNEARSALEIKNFSSQPVKLGNVRPLE